MQLPLWATPMQAWTEQSPPPAVDICLAPAPSKACKLCGRPTAPLKVMRNSNRSTATLSERPVAAALLTVEDTGVDATELLAEEDAAEVLMGGTEPNCSILPRTIALRQIESGCLQALGKGNARARRPGLLVSRAYEHESLAN